MYIFVYIGCLFYLFKLFHKNFINFCVDHKIVNAALNYNDVSLSPFAGLFALFFVGLAAGHRETDKDSHHEDAV